MLPDKDHKLLSQLNFQKKQNLNVKTIAVLKSAAGATGGSGASASATGASSEVIVLSFVVVTTLIQSSTFCCPIYIGSLILQ